MTGTFRSVPGLSGREPPADEAALLARLRAGDARAFETLVITYQHRVFGVAFRMLGSRAEAEGLTYEEIAEALGLELGTVRSRLHRARLDLKSKLERFLP